VGAAARADDPATLRAEADRLAAENAALSTRAESALLELYAVESRLHRAEGEVARLEERVVVLEGEERLARRRLGLARTAETTAQKQLGDRLRALYVEGETDPIAVLLGATSLGDAIDVLDGLERFAEEDDRIIAQVQEARVSLRSALRTLARRERELRALVAEAEAARAALAAAREEKAGYLDSLVRQRQLNESEILALEASAASAEREAAEIQASAPESSHAPAAVAVTQEEAGVAVEPAPAPSDGFDGSALSAGQVTVSMTMYCLTGFTATGIPVGPGVVATDPTVIPLGTGMSIPGYGDGVAADTGSGVQGLAIDAWVESCEQAAAFGGQTVTITIHG
jgi:3D (Asp-Asp-Asp) domain-containing protein/septal ring factor EnvC (AmiA/AmiB activator)